jgi:hypothetical protein
VTYSVKRINPGTYFEGRITMPKNAFSGGAKGTHTNEEIAQQESSFIRKTEGEKFRLRVLLFVLISMSLLLSSAVVWSAVNQIKQFMKFGKDDPLPMVNQANSLWEPPSDIDPAQIEQIIAAKEVFSSKSFTATVLSLVQDRFFKLVRSDKKEGFIKKDYKYFLLPTPNPKTAASSIQQAVLDLLLDDIGLSAAPIEGKMQDVVALDKIVSWFKQNQTEGYNFFKSFPKVVLRENLAEGYLDPLAHQMGGQIGGFGFPVLSLMVHIFGASSLAVLFAYFHLYCVMLVPCSRLARSTQCTSSQMPRNAQGRTEAAEWLAFQKHMSDYKQTKEYPITQGPVGKYLVYGTASIPERI